MNTRTLSYILAAGFVFTAILMIFNGITIDRLKKDNDFGENSNTYKMNIASIVFVAVCLLIFLILGIILYKKTEPIPVPEL